METTITAAHRESWKQMQAGRPRGSIEDQGHLRDAMRWRNKAKFDPQATQQCPRHKWRFSDEALVIKMPGIR